MKTHTTGGYTILSRSRPLGELGYGLYAVSEWLTRPKETWEFIGYDDSLRDTPQQQWLEQYPAGRAFAFLSNDLAALHQACRAGLGFAVLPHFLARGDKALIPLEEQSAVLGRPVWMIVHPDVRRSPRVRIVADFLFDLFHENAAALA